MMHTPISRKDKLSRKGLQTFWHKPIALALTASLLAPVVGGCGGQAAPPPPADATLGQAPMSPGGNRNQGGNVRQGGGMSTKQKVVLLAGAAALYYMYKRQRDANNRPLSGQTQYYLSKNGRVYYHNPQTKQAIYVTPPPGGLPVPANEANEFQQFQGYNGSTAGRSLEGLVN